MENKSIHKIRMVFGLLGIIGFIGCLAIASGWWVGATSQLITFRDRNVDFPKFLDWVFNMMMLAGFIYCTCSLILLLFREKGHDRLFYYLMALSLFVALIPSVWSYSISWQIESCGIKELLKPLVMISVPLFASIFCFLKEMTRMIINRMNRNAPMQDKAYSPVK